MTTTTTARKTTTAKPAPAKTTKTTAPKAPRKVAVKVVDTEVAERAADNADATETARTTAETHAGKTVANGGRRAKGTIDAQIIGFLEAHPGESFGSYKIAQTIGGAGACYVALKRMDKAGVVTLVSQKPDRYVLTAAPKKATPRKRTTAAKR
jgi:hypothetical protein